MRSQERSSIHLAIACALTVFACQSILGIEDTTETSGSGGATTGGSGGTGGSGAGTGGSSGGAGGTDATVGGGGTAATGGIAGSGGVSGSGASDAGADANDADACPAVLDFAVAPLADASVIRGKSVPIDVQVQLGACFSSAIDVSLQPAAGFSAPPVQIPSGQSQATLTISADTAAAFGVAKLQLSLSGGGQSHTAPLNLLVRDEAGELDQTFTIFSGGTGTVRALAVQANGAVVVAINPGASSTGWTLKRLTAEGTVDSSFNPSALPASGGVRDVSVAGNGQIVTVGDVTSGVAFVRLSSAGVGDALLGVNGVYTLPPPNFSSTPYSKWLALQSDGKPVFVGTTQNGDGIVARVDPAKSPTPEPPGKVDVQGSFQGASMSALGLQTGRFVAGGIKSNHVYLAAVSATTGSADATFGTNGSTTYSPTGFEAVLDGVVTANAIYLVGATQGGADRYPTLFRFDASGKSPTHTSVNHPGAYNITYTSCAVQADGKIVAIGFGGTSASGYNVYLTRFNADGSVDTSFAPTATMPGTKKFQVGGNTTSGAVAVAPDGRILAGVASPSGPTVVRLWN